jgi:hypothetical protein
MTSRILVIMGSGETAPTMVKTHRAVLERLDQPVSAVLLDTPYRFQENATDISGRIVEHFRSSLSQTMSVATLPDDSEPGATAGAIEAIRRARYIFSGPGSPSYALRRWRGSDVPALLDDTLTLGGAVVFASAAALTLGRWTVPVYEIYKVGEDPHWLDGLDLLRHTGIDGLVIPHFNNAEGGNHDTRFCYLGARRLAVMRSLLPAAMTIIGVDEHTALTIDLDAALASVSGLGTVTILTDSGSDVLGADDEVALSELGSAGTVEPDLPKFAPSDSTAGDPFAVGWRQLEQRFEPALRDGDIDGALDSVVGLHQLILDWAADTNQSPEGARAERALRGMLVRLAGSAQQGVRDRRELVGGLVEAVLEARSAARADDRWGEADALRDRLGALGISVKDTRDGSVWDFVEDGGDG